MTGPGIQMEMRARLVKREDYMGEDGISMVRGAPHAHSPSALLKAVQHTLQARHFSHSLPSWQNASPKLNLHSLTMLYWLACFGR